MEEVEELADGLAYTASFTNLSNDTYEYMEPVSNDSQRLIDEYIRSLYILDQDRATFRYFYLTFSAFIVLLNIALVTSILTSKKQRKLFRNWLILHVTLIHIHYGAIVCPFLGEGLVKLNAGLEIVPCKLLSFISDVLEYLSNVTIAILGIYQCLNTMSPRMLKGVSRVLLAAMMIVMPWFICVMLTAVLRITMSEEHWGECYTISDETAQTLWLVLAYGIPLILCFLCFITLIFVTCSPAITTTETTPNDRKNITLFVGVCLACSLILRPPYYFGYSDLYQNRCQEDHGNILCNRLTHSLDLLRISMLIIIPLVYLIPWEMRRGYRKIKSKLFYSVDCSANAQQNVRMVNLNVNDKTAV